MALSMQTKSNIDVADVTLSHTSNHTTLPRYLWENTLPGSALWTGIVRERDIVSLSRLDI